MKEQYPRKPSAFDATSSNCGTVVLFDRSRSMPLYSCNGLPEPICTTVALPFRASIIRCICRISGSKSSANPSSRSIGSRCIRTQTTGLGNKSIREGPAFQSSRNSTGSFIPACMQQSSNWFVGRDFRSV